MVQAGLNSGVASRHSCHAPTIAAIISTFQIYLIGLAEAHPAWFRFVGVDQFYCP